MKSVSNEERLLLLYKKIRSIYHALNYNIQDLMKNPQKKRSRLEPSKYIHIGYPKSASTALQKGFFGRHNQLYHLGSGASNNSAYWDDHGYVNEDVNVALEVDLRYQNSLSYDAGKTKKVFETEFEKAGKDPYTHAVGISNENFCFNWHGGIDIRIKAERLKSIFGEHTQIIVVLRNQKSLIESLYKENIRFGYPGTFAEFLKFLWTYKDRNFFYELHYNKVIDLYSELFGRKNLHIFFFEDLKIDSKSFLKEISKAIGVDFYNLPFSKEYNKQLSLKELYIKREINIKYPHTFGKDKYSIVDNHRYIPFFKDELKETIDEIKIDYQTRNSLNKLSSELSTDIETPKISLNWDNVFGTKILDSLSYSNQELVNDKTLREKIKKYNYIKL